MSIIIRNDKTVVGFTDNAGMDWFFIGGRIVIPETLKEDPHSGYTCNTLLDALDILWKGGYITDRQFIDALYELEIVEPSPEYD